MLYTRVSMSASVLACHANVHDVEMHQPHFRIVNSLPVDTMAVPPGYADLGKSAKDIFNKGFGMIPYSLIK